MRAPLFVCATTAIAVLLGLGASPAGAQAPATLARAPALPPRGSAASPPVPVPTTLAQAPGTVRESLPPPTPREVAEAAQEAERSHWRPEWRRFDVADGMLVVVAEAAGLAICIAQPVTQPLWRSTLPLDDEIRDAFRVTDQGMLDLVITVSDVLFLSMLAWPVLVDSILLAGVLRGDGDVALQMGLIDVEVLAVAQVATWLTSRLTGRVRPEAVDCIETDTCEDKGSGPVQSFVGGHSLMGFASAGLTCTHHLENPWISGSIEGAVATCASGLAIATTIGFLRIAADRHWLSDVALGSMMGAAIGFGLPYLLHYRVPGWRGSDGDRSRARGSGPTFAITPGHGGDPRGMGIFGVF